MSPASRAAAALRREVFYFFVKSVFAELHGGAQPSNAPYLEAMCYALQSSAAKEGGRLLVTIPPRHLKSIAGAVALPAWIMGRDPSAKVMVATYGDELSREHADAFRRVITAGWYNSLFPGFKIRSSTNTELRTTGGGIRKSVTLGGATTGFGADLIIIDDLMKAQDAGSDVRRETVRGYYRDALLSRFNDPKRGSLISIQQRLHEDDLPAALIESGRYTHLNLPAIAETQQKLRLYQGRRWDRPVGEPLDPHRLPAAQLDVLRDEIGAAAFSAQYQQKPVPPDGAIIAIDKLSLTENIPDRLECQRVVQSWDTAAKTGPHCDFSVGTTWGFFEQAWHLLDLTRARLEYPDLKARMRHLKAHWRAEEVLVEDSSNGTALVQQFRSEGELGYRLVRARHTKLERLIPQLDLLHSNQVRFSTNAPWWETLRREMAAFPDSRFDDQVDSISQFLGWIRGRQGQGFMDRNPSTGRRRMLNRPTGRH